MTGGSAQGTEEREYTVAFRKRERQTLRTEKSTPIVNKVPSGAVAVPSHSLSPLHGPFARAPARARRLRSLRARRRRLAAAIIWTTAAAALLPKAKVRFIGRFEYPERACQVLIDYHYRSGVVKLTCSTHAHAEQRSVSSGIAVCALVYECGCMCTVLSSSPQ